VTEVGAGGGGGPTMTLLPEAQPTRKSAVTTRRKGDRAR
jgi:hypothetical protein